MLQSPTFKNTLQNLNVLFKCETLELLAQRIGWGKPGQTGPHIPQQHYFLDVEPSSFFCRTLTLQDVWGERAIKVCIFYTFSKFFHVLEHLLLALSTWGRGAWVNKNPCSQCLHYGGLGGETVFLHVVGRWEWAKMESEKFFWRLKI